MLDINITRAILDVSGFQPGRYRYRVISSFLASELAKDTEDEAAENLALSSSMTM